MCRSAYESAFQGLLVGMVLLVLGWDSRTHGQPATAPNVESPPAELTQEALAFFETRVRPLLVERCYECHAGTEAQGGLRLDFRDGLLLGGDTGPAIVPGRPEESLLVQALRYKNADLQMPPSGAIPEGDRKAIEEWVAMGAPDPRAHKPEHAPAGPQGMSVADGRRFWSLLPLSDPVPPSTENAEWNQNPIDAFVLAKLQAHGLKPSALATRSERLRRLTFDLTGLPPTADEMAHFEQDSLPDAWERAVDRFLQSPQYGVRFGRHWLDVARYADSNGLDENIALGNAWRYRDYVVESFNKDKPFDRFVEEQIAGDLLPDADRETTTGTGFLVLGAKVLAEPDREKLTMDTIDEQLDVLGKALMGMSLGCVRCHDHKFDPIKQRDYYALAAIFKGTKTFGNTNFGAIKHWNEVSYATVTEKASLKEVDAAIAEKQAAFNTAKAKAMEELRQRVRSQAHLYLACSAKLPATASLTEWSQVAQPDGLHPRVLSHCRRHLEFHREDPLFAPWHAMAERGDFEGIANHYQTLFASVRSAWEETKKKDANATKLEDAEQEAVRLALQDGGGFLAIPAKMEHALEDATIASLHALAEEARMFESAAPDETSVMAVQDHEVTEALPLHIRGSHRNLGEAIERDFPEVMRDADRRPIFSRRSSGRRELAQWLVDPNHPLTARVIVNRVWRWHFGHGLVATTENFGQLGDRPSHPELLDYLARWFIESGWSIKELNRLILTSNTYQMASRHEAAFAAQQDDPENRLLWHFPYQRLSAEQARDAILASTGMLDLRLGGKSVPLRNRQFVFDHTSVDHTRYDSYRRTLYLPIIRNHLFTMLEQFDFPDPTMPIGHRYSTTVAPQALLLMNAPWIQEAAEHLAVQSELHASQPEDRIDWLVRQTLGREARDSERREWARYVTGEEPPGSASHAELPMSRWAILTQNLLICNEFFYIK